MLNEQQQIAVTTPNASALILSGAGTGKSSVLVARIRHILAQGTFVHDKKQNSLK